MHMQVRFSNIVSHMLLTKSFLGGFSSDENDIIIATTAMVIGA
jgi:hypothetical protein